MSKTVTAAPVTTSNDLGAKGENIARLDEYMTWIIQNTSVRFRQTNTEHPEKDFMALPRFGLMSLVLAGLPVHLFSPKTAPTLAKRITTAATDGSSVWINEEFFERGYAEEAGSDGRLQFVIPTILHEGIHALLDHPQRLRRFPRLAANLGADEKVNRMLSDLLPVMGLATTVDCGGVMRSGNDEARDKSEEALIMKYITPKKIDKNVKPKAPGQSQKQPGQKGSVGQQSGGQQPDQQDPGGQQPGQKGSGGQRQGQQDSGGLDPDKEANFQNSEHMPTPQEIAAALEADGLDAAARARGLASPNDEKAYEALGQRTRRNVESAVREADAMNQASNGKLPGSALLDYSKEMLRNLHKGKINWKLKVQELFVGSGIKVVKDMGIPSMTYFVDDIGMAVGENYWGDGVPQPVESPRLMVWLIDTSGSMDLDTDLRDAVSEAFRLQAEVDMTNDGPAKVMIFMADTSVRGEPIELNQDNWEELARAGIAVKGRGGTDMENAIREMMNNPTVTQLKAKHIDFVVVSDLETAPPHFSADDMAALEGKTMTLTYLGVPSAAADMSRVKAFTAAVADTGAQVFAIDPKLPEINIDLGAEQDAPTLRATEPGTARRRSR